jgi:hypothetical protein
MAVSECLCLLTFGCDALNLDELAEVVGLELSGGHLPLPEVALEADVVLHLVRLLSGELSHCGCVESDGLLQCGLEGGVEVGGEGHQTTEERLIHSLDVVDVDEETRLLLVEHATDLSGVIQLIALQHVTELALVTEVGGRALLEEIHRRGGGRGEDDDATGGKRAEEKVMEVREERERMWALRDAAIRCSSYECT